VTETPEYSQAVTDGSNGHVNRSGQQPQEPTSAPTPQVAPQPEPPTVPAETDGRADSVPAATPAPVAGERIQGESRRRWPLAAAQVRRLAVLAMTIILMGTGGGLLGALAWPATYAARAEILYPITQEQPTGFLREDRNLTTQLVLLQGRAVLGPVAAAEGRAVSELQDNLTVELLESSEIIQIEVRDRSAEAALRTVQAIVDRYFGLNEAAQPSGVLAYLEAELAEARAGVADARGRLLQLQGEVATGVGDPAAIVGATDELQAWAEREKEIQAQIDETNVISRSGPVGQLLTPPYVLADPVSPRPLFAAATGLLVGLIVAAGAVALAARRWARN
jgi:capsular polysaccharide biosynthesis protein